eukprot:SAG31_NODE_26820_length_436_cov_0.632047_1_plen_78_part_01
MLGATIVELRLLGASPRSASMTRQCRLTGGNSDDKTVDISNYHLTEDGYLMHLDRVTNMMATVIPTKSAQESLIKMFH